MPSGQVFFEATWARCLEHKTLLEPGEIECIRCKILKRNLSLVPKFKVYCINDEWGEVKAGTDYEVIWVIKEGTRQHGNIKGYVFEVDDNSLNDYVFNAENFIPHEFLTDDLKDSWLPEEPPKTDNNPVLTEKDLWDGIMG